MAKAKVTLHFLESRGVGIIGFSIIPLIDTSNEVKKFCRDFPNIVINKNAQIRIGTNELLLIAEESEFAISCGQKALMTISHIFSCGSYEVEVFSLEEVGGFSISLKSEGTDNMTSDSAPLLIH